MTPIDWRELYASNRAAIERAVGAQGKPPSVPAMPELAGRTPGELPSVPAMPMLAGRAPVLLRRLRHGARERSFVGAAAGRDPLVHLPAGVDRETAVPLVCMLHGCTQDAEAVAAATRMNAAADRHGFAVVYPRQAPGANPQRCWNWFLPEHQRRGGGEPARIAASVRALLGAEARQAIDARRVFVAGLSAGGAMAAILAYTHPDLFAAVAVHSGLPFGAAGTVQAAFALMANGSEDPAMLGPAAHAAMGERARPVPSMVVHGDADPTVAPVNGEQVLRQSMAVNRLAGGAALDPGAPTEIERGRAPDGHAFTRSRWADDRGRLVHERLIVHGLGHAWSGGLPGGSHTDPRGPDASEAILRFFERLAAGKEPTTPLDPLAA
jgi:poly(hydroxyalkanoate) depolymerase family esterase